MNRVLTPEQEKLYCSTNGFSLQNLFFTLYGVFPNCFLFKTGPKDSPYEIDVNGILDDIKSNVLKEDDVEPIIYTSNQIGIEPKEEIVFSCILKDRHTMFRIDTDLSECYILYDSSSIEMAHLIKTIIENHISFISENENTVFRLNFSQGYYSLTSLKVKTVDNLVVTKQYNDDFVPQDAKIRNFIAENDKSGLVILHGTKGTGKTTYIKKLINDYPKRKFIFITSNLIPLLADPSFSSFLPKLSDSVLILEDCEEAVKSRKVSGNSNVVSILLNMTDGLLSDDLSLKFICTFNEDIKNIDDALLRKGRLISKYEFTPLSVEKSNALLKEIFAEDENVPTTNVPLTLADIYKYKEESYETKKKSII